MDEVLSTLGQMPGSPEGRIFISGTGRAGTTFLVQLLTRLGLDTGFRGDETEGVYFQNCRAGFERYVLDPNGPKIVKSPWFCDLVDDVIRAGIKIEHVIIPVRNFAHAAASREYVQRETTGSADGVTVPGGLWGTETAQSQQAVLREKFTNLIEALVRHDVPMTFLDFPRSAKDPDYLYAKLNFLVSGVSLDSFKSTFLEVSRPDLIHNFAVQPTPS